MHSATSNDLVLKWTEAAQSLDTSAGPEWLQAVRGCAAARFGESGLPHRKVEAWKYTPVRMLEILDPPLARGNEHAFQAVEFPPPLLERTGAVIDIADGQLTNRLPEPVKGVTFMPLGDGICQFEDRLRPLIEDADINGPGRAFTALNTAFLDQGLVVHVAEGVDAGSLLIRWAFSPGELARWAHFRIFLLLEPGAKLELIEQFQSAETSENALNVMIQAELGRGAEWAHIRVQSESESAVLLTSTSVELAAGSRYVYRGFDLGGALVRHELKADLAGRGASTEISGAFVLDGRRHVDNHVSVNHLSPDCSSEQFFRGVLGGRSRGVFNGRALIQPGADGSSVRQSNANLLLSALAEMDTKPELEIYADEVEASHGATVGQLDETAVFYLRTRGLSDSAARRMLTAAFCHAVTDRLEDRALAERVSAMLNAAMPGGQVGD